MNLLRRLTAVYVLLTVLPNAAVAGGASEIWLSGVAPFLQQKMFQEPSSGSDYLDLFKPGASWQKESGGQK